MGYLPLANCHSTLSDYSMTQSPCHEQFSFSAKIARSVATNLLVRHSEASPELLTETKNAFWKYSNLPETQDYPM